MEAAADRGNDPPSLSTAPTRREFLSSCSGWLAAATASALASDWSAATQVVSRTTASADKPKQARLDALLVDPQGRPLQVSHLKPRTNYIFHYPFLATPCLLLDLGREVGGAGRRKSVVAFSAICSHKLAYPAKEVSFIRFQAEASAKSAADHIHCCADHSVYDPAQGARVIAGPAPEPLAQILLEYDPQRDHLRAVGVRGVDQFEAFFRKYEFKLSMDYGARAREPVRGQAMVTELTAFCRNVATC